MSIVAKKINGTNKYTLLQSQSQEIIDIYNEVFSKVEGSLTTVIDNDAVSKFNVANASLHPTTQQNGIINEFKISFKDIEKVIDPVRLNFTISKAIDNEICINRTSEEGVSNIIIHEDGIVAFSFIAFKGKDKKDILDFFEKNIDFESITYNFFS